MHTLYVASDFLFLGAESAGTDVHIMGSGHDVSTLLKAKVTAGFSLATAGTASIQIRGEQTVIAVGATRFTKDGKPWRRQ